jgi:hypothetical protein
VNITPRAKLSREASQCFDAPAAERELSPAELQEWDRWRAGPDNMVVYEEIARLMRFSAASRAAASERGTVAAVPFTPSEFET